MYTDFMAFMRKSGKLSDDLEAEMQVEVRASPRLASPRVALPSTGAAGAWGCIPFDLSTGRRARPFIGCVVSN